MSNKMIALFSDSYRPKIDGVAVSLEILGRELRRREFEFDLYAPEFKEKPVDPDNVYRFKSIPSFLYPEVRLSTPLELKSLKNAFSSKYSLVHSFSPGTLGIMAEQVASVRRVPHFHTFFTQFNQYTHYIFRGKVVSPKMIDRVSRWWSNNMDFIIAPSGKIKSWLEEIGISTEIRVIPMGIDTSSFRQPTQQSRIRDRFMVDSGWVKEDDFVVFCISRLGKEKSIVELIWRFAEIPQLVERRIKLVITGDGPQKQELVELVGDLGLGEAVIFTGFVDPKIVPRLYASADIFAFMSTSETQGLVVVEAIASGLPVLLSRDGAFDGMIADGGNGFYIESNSDFVNGVLNLYKSDQRRVEYGSKSIEMSKNFDIGTTTDRLLEYYEYGLGEWEVSKKKKMAYRMYATGDRIRKGMQKQLDEMRKRILD